MKQLLSLALACVALPACAQTPPSTPPPVQPGVQGAPAAGAGPAVSERSRISHLVAGPDGRPQGFLLRNGTFVTLSPGLAQKIPTTVRRNETVRVSGPEFSSNGKKSIQAQNVTIAGVTYNDTAALPMGANAPAPGGLGAPPPPPPAAAGAVPPPPPPGGPGAMAPPPPPGRAGGAPPPPPPPCGNGAAPPPPPAQGAAAPPPPPAPASAGPVAGAPAGAGLVAPAPAGAAAPAPPTGTATPDNASQPGAPNTNPQ